jgi:hypothetical protein
MDRVANTIPITFRNGQTVSGIQGLHRGGSFGTFIVPVGSDAIGKTIQFVATRESADRGAPIPDADMLSAAKSLSAGANPLTQAEIYQVGAANYCKFKLNAPVTQDTTIYLLWKS